MIMIIVTFYDDIVLGHKYEGLAPLAVPLRASESESTLTSLAMFAE